MMRRILSLLVAVLLVVTAAPWMPGGTGSVRAEPKVSGPGTTLVVMDTSGSMSAETEGGATRLDEARSAVLKTVDSLPTGAQFGLIAYPGNGREVDGCSIGDEEIKLGPLEAGSVATAVRRLTADGDTPTGPALRHAADLIKRAGGNGTIIVVSDGQANCGSSDLCAVAQSIAADGVGIQAHTVGFHYDDDQLSCVAKILGGRHVNVTEPGALDSVLEELSGARLEFDLQVPKEMAEVPGTGTQGSTITATVRSTGQHPANNVRVAIEVTDPDGKPTQLSVPRPVRFLGNLAPGGKPRTVSMTIRPPEGSIGDYRVRATAHSVNTGPVQQTGAFRVVGKTPMAGLLGDARSVAVLGDSYSSGEGTSRYFGGTDDPGGNNCHRSEFNYGGVLFGSQAYTIACSGAVTSDLTTSQPLPSREHGEIRTHERPQLERLHEVAGDRPVDAVMMTLGGNDIGFGPVVRECIQGDCRKGAALAREKASEETFVLGLIRAYQSVDRTLNDASARAQRGDRQAPIVVLPYPRPIPTNDQIAGDKNEMGQLKNGHLCMTGTSVDELRALNPMLDTLNASIRLAVDIARSEGIPVYYAQEIVEAFLPDHTICDSDSYVVNNVPANALPRNHQQIAHPNRKGYDAMAKVLRAWSQVTAPMPTAADRDTKYSDVPILGTSTADRVSGVIAAPARRLDLFEPGSLVQKKEPGYAKDGVVTITVNSTPRMVGAFVADENGAVNAAFRLPADLEPGRHTIVVTGLDAQGNPKESRTSITVLPRYSGIMAVVFLVGVVLAVGGAFSLRRARKRRAAASTG
ncbi:VWA domain-containing protein [Gordonia phosphorivorans]|uniref:VWA domain-containing protein n=1 Tax=Gordonia phosphorivorans TaxID=1056982 RepID=A0ABV6H9F8_9ACTN